jgi:hypothetical protein
MEQSAFLGQSGNVGEVFLVTNQRLREVLYFFRANLRALLAVTLPFAAAGTLSVQLFGEPVLFEGEQPGAVQWQSALLLVTLYPLALGVKTLAIHELAEHRPLLVSPLLAGALRLWPTLLAVSLLGGLFVGSVTLLSLGIGIELLQALGVLQGVGGGLLFMFTLPGIYLYGRVGSASIIAAVEGRSALDSLGAAWRRSLPDHVVLFNTLLAVISALLLVFVALFAALAAAGDDVVKSAAGDFLARGLSEWLFCVVTVTFYRFWSLQPRSE